MLWKGFQKPKRLAADTDTLTEKYLTDPNTITEAEIRKALRKGTIDFKLHPVFCGSALSARGRQAKAPAGPRIRAPSPATCGARRRFFGRSVSRLRSVVKAEPEAE